MFLCKIVWGIEEYSDCPESGHIEIFSFDELETFLNRFEEEHQNVKATVVEIILPTDESMAIALGRQESFLRYSSKFFPYSEDPKFFQPRIYYKSIGNHAPENQEVFEFWEEGCYNEYKIDNFIPRKLARYAVLYFVQTNGKLTEKVTWKNPFDWNLSDNLDDGKDKPF